jgi:hypothetical protein
LTGFAALMSTDSVGCARRFSGTLSKITRAGRLSSRRISMREPTRNTVPSTVDSTSAFSLVSAPVAGLTRISRTVLPTAFSMSLAGVSRS